MNGRRAKILRKLAGVNLSGGAPRPATQVARIDRDNRFLLWLANILAYIPGLRWLAFKLGTKEVRLRQRLSFPERRRYRWFKKLWKNRR